MDRIDDELPSGMREAFKALDGRAAERAARVDVERVAARVVERLRQPEVTRRVWWMTPVALRAAAAVVVLAAAGLVVQVSVKHGEQSEALRLPVAIPAMDSLNSGQLEAVLEATGQVRPAADSLVTTPSGRSLDDLSEDQLKTLLASLGGAES